MKQNKTGIFYAYSLFWRNYLNFRTNSSRSAYWWTFMWNWLIRAIFMIWGLMTILKTGSKFNLGIILFIIYSLLALLPSLSLTARRYQDAGISKWWMLFTYLLPYILYFITRMIDPNSLSLYLFQNAGAFLEFICVVVAVILPVFPSQSKN